MAIINPPAFMQAGSYGPRLTRLAYGDFISAGGVADATSYLVTPGGGMSVNVSAGYAYVVGDESVFQGTYGVLSEQIVNLPVPDNVSTTNSRTDMVYLIVKDSDFSGSTDGASIELAIGTPGNPPTLPLQPFNSIPLALITVLPSTDTILVTNISDYREGAKLNEFMLQQNHIQPPNDFEPLTPAANWVWDGAPTPTLGVRNFAGKIEFKGTLKYTGPTVTTTSAVTICNLPTQYWPENSIRAIGYAAMRYKRQTFSNATSNVSHNHTVVHDLACVRVSFDNGKLVVHNHASRATITESTTQRIYLNGFWYAKDL